uniref:Uncharacterized protein n=1 Tax=Setaria viridis TaxID=4556 RepID=A0A4U6T8M6_SETVI|nr:hypothetical protein SEVIR_9G545850v2 [Setaria viridis]
MPGLVLHARHLAWVVGNGNGMAYYDPIKPQCADYRAVCKLT